MRHLWKNKLIPSKQLIWLKIKVFDHITMNFIDILFPSDIGYKSVGGPSFSTNVLQTTSGHEIRSGNWPDPLYKFDISYGINSKKHIEDLLDFFLLTKGRAHSFRFRDWIDFAGFDEEIGIGNGTNTEFSIIKNYQFASEQPYQRKITKIAPKTMIIKIGDKNNTPVYNETITVDRNKKLIKFAKAPVSDADIKVSFITNGNNFDDQSLGFGDGEKKEFKITTDQVITADSVQVHTNDKEVFDEGLINNNNISVDHNTGIITFGTAPAQDQKIFASYEFDVLVRFDVDHLPISMNENNGYFCQKILLVEVKS